MLEAQVEVLVDSPLVPGPLDLVLILLTPYFYGLSVCGGNLCPLALVMPHLQAFRCYVDVRSRLVTLSLFFFASAIFTRYLPS